MDKHFRRRNIVLSATVISTKIYILINKYIHNCFILTVARHFDDVINSESSQFTESINVIELLRTVDSGNDFKHAIYHTCIPTFVSIINVLTFENLSINLSKAKYQPINIEMMT